MENKETLLEETLGTEMAKHLAKVVFGSSKDTAKQEFHQWIEKGIETGRIVDAKAFSLETLKQIMIDERLGYLTGKE